MPTASRASQLRLVVLVWLSAVFVAGAQVPRGWYVVSCFQNAPTAPGNGGIFFVHPRTPGPATPVTGLPSSLTGAGLPALTGANSVAIRHVDGALIVGGAGPPGTLINLHVITLSGSAVASDVPMYLGTETSPFGGGVVQTALLPSGDVVVAVFGIGTGPLAGASVGLVTPSTGVVTPIPISFPPGVIPAINAMCVDPVAGTIYMSSNPGGASATVYSVPLAGGTPSAIVSLPSNLSGLALLPTGQLLGTALGPLDMITIALPSGAWSVPCSLPLGTLNAVALESNTGGFAVVSGAGGTPPRSVSFINPSCAATVLAQPPATGWGATSGIDISPAMFTYGPSTPGGIPHSWVISPNPGGLPLVGNAGFSLTLSSGPGSPPGLWVASGSSWVPPVPFAGVSVNVDLNTVILSGQLFGLPLELIPLPVPPIPSLAGAQVFFQAAYSDIVGLVATDGLSVTVL